jgi:hypothetical protein
VPHPRASRRDDRRPHPGHPRRAHPRRPHGRPDLASARERHPRAAFRGLFDRAGTRDALARANGRRNLARLRTAIELHLSGSAGTRSNAEDAFLRLIDRHLERPLVNTHLLDEEVDFHWPDRRLVVEVDGPGHARPSARRDDARRDAKLTAAGSRVLRFSDRDVYSGAALQATLGSACGARGATSPAAA